jgi:hypothetical protein
MHESATFLLATMTIIMISSSEFNTESNDMTTTH